MAGFPRVVADGLTLGWQQEYGREPEGYDDIRNWVSQLIDNDWKKAIPNSTRLTPSGMRLIWQEFAGQKV